MPAITGEVGFTKRKEIKHGRNFPVLMQNKITVTLSNGGSRPRSAAKRNFIAALKQTTKILS